MKNVIRSLIVMLSLIFGLMLFGCSDDDGIEEENSSLSWPEEWTPDWGKGYSSGTFIREDTLELRDRTTLNFWQSKQGYGSTITYRVSGVSMFEYYLTSIRGKEMKVKKGTAELGQQYTLCTNWTFADNTLVLTGGDFPEINDFTWVLKK